MTAIERNIRQTQFRLRVNEWLVNLGWALVTAAAGWCIVVVVARLLGKPWPLFYIGLGLVAGGVIVSAMMALFRRQDPLAAAIVWDRAADLKERTSSGWSCLTVQDPFAQAVVQDAEKLNSRVSVRSFVKFIWPSSLSFASLAVVVATIVTLLPISPLQANQKLLAKNDSSEQAKKTEIKRVKRQLETLKEQAEKNPALKDLETQLKTLDQLPVEKLDSTVSVRREAIKKIDQLADALKEQQKGSDQSRQNELKRMFRGLNATKPPENPVEKMSQSLAQGDFKAAQDAIKEMQEQLAKLTETNDQQKQQALQKQMEELTKRLDSASKQSQQKEQLQKEMEKMGVDKKTAQKALETLTKEDIQKAVEEMKKKGASEQQIKEVQKKCESCKSAGQQGSQMASAMKQAAEAMKEGQSGSQEALQQLQEVGDQLSQMEQMEQQLSEMESTLAELQEMKNEMANADQSGGGFEKCENCGGKGCKQCEGSGQSGQGSGGMGQQGQGRGGRADEEETAVKFKKERTPVVTQAGSIISKMFIDGEQIKGDISTEAVELISAADRDATDAISKNKIPNQYRSAVKSYFSQVRKDFAGSHSPDDSTSVDPSSVESDKPEPDRSSTGSESE